VRRSSLRIRGEHRLLARQPGDERRRDETDYRNGDLAEPATPYGAQSGEGEERARKPVPKHSTYS
jgi:hypothetical protein